MSAEPTILGAIIKSTLEALEEKDPEIYRGVRAHMPPESVAAIEEASRISWIPIEHDVALTRSVFAVAGREQGVEIFRRMMGELFESPVLAPLIDGAIRLLGREPNRVLRWSPKVWTHLMRDAGEMVYEDAGPGVAYLRFRDLPATLRNSDYLAGLAGAASALFDVIGVEGSAEAEKPRSDASVALVLSWKVED